MGKKKADKTKPVVVKTKAKAKEPEVVEIFDTDDLSEDVVEEREAEQFEGEVAFAAHSTDLVPFLNRLLDTVNTKTAIPAIAENCSCGASLSISESVPEADRKRMHNAFLRSHKPCLPAAE